MKEIKFRAWDKERKIMFSPNSLGFDIKGNLVSVDANNEHLNQTRDCSFLVLMQYTGLKDKNGMEIYEGDIVKDETGEIEIVFYDDYSVMFQLKDKEDRKYSFMTKDLASEKYEVIGNLYENPELLKEVER